ncbi:hypothetical protein KBD20_01400 [Candidatus Saccharibacteria bacterium]|nr:hypothetical protein [Candidatus Saccharibacteria bacterium]
MHFVNTIVMYVFAIKKDTYCVVEGVVRAAGANGLMIAHQVIFALRRPSEGCRQRCQHTLTGPFGEAQSSE